MADGKALVEELGHRLGIELKFSNDGVCGVLFDRDEVTFELSEDRLYMIAEIGHASDREEVFGRLLTANYLGSQTGLASIGLDVSREVFVLTRIFEGDLEYNSFENATTLFVKAVRYWKEWLNIPTSSANNAPTDAFSADAIYV